MAESGEVRSRFQRIKDGAMAKTKPGGWVLPMEKGSLTDEGTYSNIDMDVTPIERRTWTALTMAGFWFSDALNAQSWEAPASIIAVGLT